MMTKIDNAFKKSSFDFILRLPHAFRLPRNDPPSFPHNTTNVILEENFIFRVVDYAEQTYSQHSIDMNMKYVK